MNTHYVNNGALLAALIQYQRDVRAAKKAKKMPPPLTDDIGICFLMIAEHLSRKPNFISYTFREEMISDAVENCVQYVGNFSPAKSKNPFAYFTQIIYYAFLRRIHKEKKQLYVKYKATEQLGALQQSSMHNLSEDTEHNRSFQVYENISDYIRTYEQGRQIKKRRKPKISANSGVFKFVGD